MQRHGEREAVTWTRRTDLQNTGSLEAEARRTYTLDGGLYPRISLALYRREYSAGHGIVVNIAQKSKAGRWWENRPCPDELLGELAEMLLEVKA